MSFQSCIDGAVADRVLDAEDGAELKRRYAAELEAAKGDRAAARDSLAQKLDAEGLERRRRDLLAAAASKRIADDVRGYRGPDGKPDVVQGVVRLFENVGHTGYESVRGRFNALFGAALSEIGDGLRAFRRGGEARMVLDDVARAAFGEDADPRAKAFYQAWLKPAEKLRQLFNEAGGTIGWRDDWGLPQRHDAGAVLRAGLDAWRDAIGPRLDWEKMRHPASDTPILPGERADVLEHVWRSIVMDGWNTREPSRGGGGRPSLARARSDARFLVFRDADGWLAYNRDFGTGNVFDTLLGHTKSLARDVAQMQRLGPNPAATVQWLKGTVAQEGARYAAGDPSLYRPGLAARIGSRYSDGSIPYSIRGASSLVDAMYEQARGSDMPRGLVDEGLSFVRNWQTSAKLGSAIGLHATVNPALLTNAMAHYGLPVSRLVGDVARSFAGADARAIDRAGMIVTDAMHTLEQGAREAAAMSRAVKWSEWLPHLTTKYSGLEGGVQALRRAWWWGASNGITEQLGQAWSDLPPRLREYLLEGFGLDERDWRIMQAAKPGGEAATPFLRWQDIRDAGLDNHAAVGAAIGADTATPEGAIAAAKAAEDTALRYLGMLHQAQEFAVPSSRWRSTVALTGGTRQGTWANRLFRSFAMFKGFIGSATVSYLEALRHELARDRATGAAAAGANLLALTALGTLALQLKTLSTGKDALPMDPRTTDGAETLAHGLATSGALGIFGDYLAADVSSYGHSLTETLAGPIVSGASDLVGAAQGAVKHAWSGKSKDGEAGAAAVKLLRNNTPVLSTHWALRAAYNRILLDQLQYLADPNAHRNMRKIEQRVAKDTGQGYWWRPGAPAPERWPQLTPAR